MTTQDFARADGALVSQHNSDDPGLQQRCARCGGPKNRAQKQAKYCASCSSAAYLEGRRRRGERHGNRQEFDRVLSLWRSGVLQAALKQVEGSRDG